MNATSLTIDPDEFMARMVAAGVPDMQLVPSSSAAMPLITRTSNSSIAGRTMPTLVQGPPGAHRCAVDRALNREGCMSWHELPGDWYLACLASTQDVTVILRDVLDLRRCAGSRPESTSTRHPGIDGRGTCADAAEPSSGGSCSSGCLCGVVRSCDAAWR